MKQLLQEIQTTLDRPQALGLCALISLAQREATTVEYQQDEMNFYDVPKDIIWGCDALTEDSQLELIAEVSRQLLENYTKLGAIA